MSYIVDYGELDALMGAYNGAISIWRSAISTMKGQADAVKGSTNISGNSADRMRDYLDMTYSCASVTMSMVLEMFQKSFLLYTEAYHQQVDASAETHISEEELSEHRTSLQGKRSRMQQIALSAETAVSGISDLVALPSLDIGAADAEFSTILTSLDDLDAAVNGVESAYSSGGITEINDLLANSTAFLQEMCRQSEDFKTSFTAASFVGLASVPALMSSINNANAWLSANESQVSVAVEHLEQRLAIQQAEYEKRERRAKWAKAAVAVVAVVATTAAVATGVGTLLVPVICGVGKCAFNAAADEYVKHDFNTDQWDKAYIGKEAVKGWFSGFTSGILPPGTGDIVKAGLSSANSALWGGLDNAYDQMVTTGTISDTTSILFDAEKSGVSSFVGDLAGNAVSDQLEGLPIGMGLDKYTNPSDDVRHYIGKFVSGAVDKVSSGVAERFASTSVEIMYDAERNSLHGQDLLKGIDVGERYKGVLDLEKMGLDFATGGTKEVVSSHITEHTLDPDTGLTPILQAKLGYETNPETGFTAVVQDSLAHIVDEDEFHEILAGMEESNPSTGANAAFAQETSANVSDTIDWENTANSSEEIRWIMEADQDDPAHATIQATTEFEEPVHRKLSTPKSGGTWQGDRGNGEFYPDDPDVRQAMAAYGRESVTYTDDRIDLSPFSEVDTPWGRIDTKVEIGHMTGARAGNTPDGMPGNYEQAEIELENKIMKEYGEAGATRDAVRAWIKTNRVGRTWHEDPDRKTMMSVPTDINDKIPHTGGKSESEYAQKMGDVSHYYGE